jgi:hypothetical protein
MFYYLFFLSPNLSGLSYFMGEIVSRTEFAFLFFCQEQSTDKNKFISTGCTGTPLRQMQSKEKM